MTDEPTMEQRGNYWRELVDHCTALTRGDAQARSRTKRARRDILQAHDQAGDPLGDDDALAMQSEMNRFFAR